MTKVIHNVTPSWSSLLSKEDTSRRILNYFLASTKCVALQRKGEVNLLSLGYTAHKYLTLLSTSQLT